MAAYKIGGSLPFMTGGGAMFEGLSGNDPLQALAAHYQQAFTSAAQANQAIYGNTMAGYQKVLGGLMGDAGRIKRGYGKLSDLVLGDVANVGQARRQEMSDEFAAREASGVQDLISRGLGSTTVLDSLKRGSEYDEQKAANQLADSMAQLRAGYRSNIGLAGMSAQERMANAIAQGGYNQVNFMGSAEAPYPDSGAYGSLAQMIGQQRAAEQQMRELQGMMAGSANTAAYNASTGGFGAMPGLAAFNARNNMLSTLSEGGAFRGLGGPGYSQGGPSGGFSLGGGGGPGQASGLPPDYFSNVGGMNPYGVGSPTTFGGASPDRYGYNLGLGATAGGTAGMGPGPSSINPYGVGGSGFGGGFGSSGASFGGNMSIDQLIAGLGGSIASGLAGLFR